MATKFCPNCGAEYVATVEVCLDCDVPLTDEAPAPDRPAEAESTASNGGHVEYELADWASESRGMLTQLLVSEAIPHVWEAGNLVVPDTFEVRTDALIDQVEVTTLPTLDPDAPKLAYDVEDWTDEQQTELMAALERAGVAYEFDAEGALVVLEDNEDRVESILDAIEFPDGAPSNGDDDEDDDDEDDDDEDDDDDDDDDEADDDRRDDDDDDDENDEDRDVGTDEGLDAAEVMSDLFVASDRLMHDARDPEGVLSMVERAAEAAQLALPYGFNRAVWNDIVAQADGLNELIGDDESSDEAISDAARVLRDTLRQYV